MKIKKMKMILILFFLLSNFLSFRFLTKKNIPNAKEIRAPITKKINDSLEKLFNAFKIRIPEISANIVPVIFNLLYFVIYLLFILNFRS